MARQGNNTAAAPTLVLPSAVHRSMGILLAVNFDYGGYAVIPKDSGSLILEQKSRG